MFKKITKNLNLLLYYSFGNKFPHKIYGKLIRRFLVKNIIDYIGKNAIIHPNVYFGKGEGLNIGNNSIVGPESRIILGGEVIIGDDVQIGPRTMILTGNHNFNDKNLSFSKQGSFFEKVLIKDDVWIGANVTILPGVVLGKGAIVGAGSVLTKDVEEFSVVAGNPATHIRYRGEPKESRQKN